MRNVSEAEWGNIRARFSMLHDVYPNAIIAIYPDTCNVMQVNLSSNVGEQISLMRFYSRTPELTAEQEKIIMDVSKRSTTYCRTKIM